MRELYGLLELDGLRSRLLLPSMRDQAMHMAFLGNPGTGKPAVLVFHLLRLGLGVRVSKIGKFCNKVCKNFKLQNFKNFKFQARSRLYQNEILQENMRLTAFFKFYKICILLHRCNLNISAQDRFEKSAIFVKFQQKNCKCRKIYKICQISEISA